MERRALIALALSFVVFMGFMYYGEKTKGPIGAPSCHPNRPGANGPGAHGPGPGSGSRASHPAGEAATGPSGQRRGGGHPLV